MDTTSQTGTDKQLSEQARILGHAADSGNIEEVRSILAAFPAVLKARGGIMESTPLHFAAAQGHIEIIHVLIDAGADVNAREGASDTMPLHWAARGGHLNAANLLLARGADLAVADGWQNLSAVGWAAAIVTEPRIEMVDLLLAHGGHLDIFSALALNRAEDVRRIAGRHPESLRQRTNLVKEELEPLHFAAARNLPQMAEVLLSCGADVNGKSSWGRTPLAMAIWDKHEHMIELLEGCNPGMDVSVLLARRQPAEAGVWLAEREDLVRPQGANEGLLHFVVRQGAFEETSLLLAAGSDPDGPGKLVIDELLCEASPLHQAAYFGHAEVAELLMRSGADPNQRTKQVGHFCYWDVTPLHVAAWCGHLDVARLLVEGGADTGLKDRHGIGAPGDWAQVWDHHDVAAFLQALDGSQD